MTENLQSKKEPIDPFVADRFAGFGSSPFLFWSKYIHRETLYTLAGIKYIFGTTLGLFGHSL